IFKFKECRFRIEKAKESTARVVVFRDFNIMNSFTLESSFFGVEEGIDKDEDDSEVLGIPKKLNCR
ncbi:hypothetical protein NL529_34235, partial [Klebsiella pneumoniae]|nr:hypothetical protein [Klebsiella pneumoniae]